MCITLYRLLGWSQSSLLDGSRTWTEDCCGGEAELPEDTPTNPAHPVYAAAHTAAHKGRDARASISLEDDLHDLLARNSKSAGGVLVLLLGVVVLAWVLGACGASWAWLMVSIGVTWALVTGALQRAADDAARYEWMRVQRRRALQADETCEWLNLLLNRWWVFSSASIFARLKAALDPRLHEAKPAFLETICLKQLSLGERTPVLRSVRTWDVTTTAGGVDGSPRRPLCPSRPPPGLAHAPTHTMALMCDLALDSDTFSAILAARIGGKGMGVELEVGVEKLAVLGRVVVTVTLDMEAPFPHLTRIALSFTEKPQVWFSVRILKAVQMMEVPVLKTWLHSLVTDALATAWVDPGQLEINIHSTEVIVPETRPGDTLAQGVLTVILWTLKGTSGVGLDEDKWVVVMVDGQQHVTPAITMPRWQEACSFLVSSSPNHHNLVLKVKTKRLITTTLTQYDLPLSQYGLDTCRVAETVLQKKGGKVIGGSVPSLHVRLQYTPLTPVNLDSPLPTSLVESQEGAGVLYILVHGADNITTASDYQPSPYCLIFSNRRKVKTTHYVCECGSPQWECGVEVLVRDVATVTLAVAVCSLPRGAQDTELLGLASLSLATVELPIVRRRLPLTRSLPTPGGATSSTSSPGTVTVTVVFRSVPSVAGCNISSTELGSEKGLSSSVGSMPASQPSPPLTSCPSMPLGDDDDLAIKKRSNTPWYSQASRFLGTTRDGETGTQDIGDILASGLGLIELTIIRARDLVAKDLNGYSDPYCVVKVNGEVKYRTRVKKKTLDPEWEETLMTHLPKHPDALAITLWDHDAFGRDFLGSVSLREADVRQMSQGDAPVWCALEGTKSGQLEIRVKVISDDYEHQLKSSQATMIMTDSGPTATEDPAKVDSECPEDKNEDGVAPNPLQEDSEIVVPKPSPSLEDEEVRGPRAQSRSVSYASNGVHDPLTLTNGRRASESAIIDSKRDPLAEERNGTFSGSATPSCASPVHTSSRSRKTGARIIANALSMARARPRTETSSEASSTTASPTRGHQSPASITKPLPKISLTEHSEDDYGGSSPEHHHKNKKSSDGGLRAVRDKMRRGFVHPLRRFRSEANMRDDLSPGVQTKESLDPRLQLALSVGVPVRVGVGGGEGDASELLDPPLTHAKSQPNLLLMASDAARLSSSTKVASSSSSGGNNSNVHGQQRSDVFVNVRGVAGGVQGLHIPRSGLQLFLRVRISDDKSSSSSLSSSFSSSFGSSGSSSGRTTKTVGRSRLVPASPSPTFECEWQVEGEVSRRALLVLEVRTASRDLLNSANLALGDLFTEPGAEGSVETWVSLQGGANLHLRASHGGQPPQSSRRRSLFRSWSLHRLGKI
ncbi:uncharacterized protein [Panulirus ornatus]|uniref:uncharacterized protein isoform X4 n=1 Tax=Panulirus ornatus TaxID=150431 RepID=UPI003A89E763